MSLSLTLIYAVSINLVGYSFNLTKRALRLVGFYACALCFLRLMQCTWHVRFVVVILCLLFHVLENVHLCINT